MGSELTPLDDLQIGFWIIGKPYFLKGKFRFFFNTSLKLKDSKFCSIETKNLLYGIEDLPPELKKEKASEAYFATGSIGSDHDREVEHYISDYGKKKRVEGEKEIYLAGRKWWYEFSISDDSQKISPGQRLVIYEGPSSPTREGLTDLARKLYSIGPLYDIEVSSLVCGGDYQKVLFPSSSKTSIVSSKDTCTSYGRKIATSLIKTAASRIFADPLQAFMEPISNSIDSYYPDRRIGKFGMGFFSIIYWIMPPPFLPKTSKKKEKVLSEARVEITSYHPRGPYHAVLVNDLSRGLVLKHLTIIKDAKMNTTGAKIVIHTSSPIEARHVQKMLSKFRYLDGIKFVFITESDRYTDAYVLYPKEEKFIGVLVEETSVTFEDYAEGIPIEVLFSSLLVPSVSTKGIETHQPKTIIKPSRIETGFHRHDDSRLIVTIGNLIVVETKTKSFTNLSKKDDKGGSIRIVLSLPADTKVIVSRDDFILDETTSRQVFGDIVRLGLTMKDLSILEELVHEYTKDTASVKNQEVFESALAEIHRRVPLAAPSEFVDVIYRKFDSAIVGSSFYSVFSLEKYLTNLVKRSEGNFWNLLSFDPSRVWAGVTVIPYESPEGLVSFGGTNSFLFVPISLIRSENPVTGNSSGWKTLVEASFTESQLLPFAKAQKKIDFGDAFPEDVTIEEKTLAMTLYSTFQAKQQWYEIPDGVITPETTYQVKKFLKPHLRPYFFSMMTALIARIRRFKPPYTYGSSKPYLVVGDTFNTKYIELVEYFIWACKNYESNVVTPPKPYFSLLRKFNYSVEDSKVLKEYFEVVRKHSKNFAHLIFGDAVLYRVLRTNPSTKDIGRIEVDLIVEMMAEIEPIVKISLNHESGIAYFLTNAKNYPLILPFDQYNIIINKYKNLSKSFSSARSEVSKILEVQKNPSATYHFKTTDLLELIFKEEYTNLSYYGRVKPVTQKEVKLQILSIAINEATSKSPEEAIVTETFQNSVDAIRSTSIKTSKPKSEGRNKIKFYLSIEKTPEGYEASYEIFDFIGMTEDQFFHLGIPFLSSKVASAIQTGEMGTGFFNVYRRATRVTVITNKNGKTIKSVDVPIRGRDHRTIDLDRTVTVFDSLPDKSSGEITGGFTSIRVTDTFPTEAEAKKVISNYQTYLLGNILSNPVPIILTLNDRALPGVPFTKAFDNEYFTIYWGPDQDFVPMVCTKGIPMMPLFDLFESKDTPSNYLFGIIVDFKNDAYTPVHSRTKINLSPKVEGVRPLCMLLASLRQQNTKIYTSKWTHTDSSSTMQQLKMGSYETPLRDNYYSFYNIIYFPFLNKPGVEGRKISIAGLIDHIIGICKRSVGQEVYVYLRNVIFYFKEREYPHDYDNLKISGRDNSKKDPTQKSEVPTEGEEKQIYDWLISIRKANPQLGYFVISYAILGVAEWFRFKKNYEIVAVDKVIKKKDQKSKIGKADPLVEKFVTLFVQEYAKLLEENFPKIGKAPTVKVIADPQNELKYGGLFYPSENKVDVAIGSFYIKSATEAVKIFKESKDPNKAYSSAKLKKNSWWTKYIWDADSIISHELEHFRRRSSHSAAHSDTDEEIFGVKGNKTFPMACSIIKNQFISKGLLTRVWKKLNT